MDNCVAPTKLRCGWWRNLSFPTFSRPLPDADCASSARWRQIGVGPITILRNLPDIVKSQLGRQKFIALVVFPTESASKRHRADTEVLAGKCVLIISLKGFTDRLEIVSAFNVI